MINEKLVSVDEMASILGVKKSWIYDKTRFGSSRIPHIKVGKYVRFSVDEVLEFLKNKGNTQEK